MREILFRGKLVLTNRWAYSRCPDGELHYGTVVHDFIPETVGQFTGLTDANGTKIFEGDILDTPDRLVKVTWFPGNAQFDCDFIKYAHGIIIKNFKGIDPRDFHLYEVIGNIHDNPELLEGSE